MQKEEYKRNRDEEIYYMLEMPPRQPNRLQTYPEMIWETFGMLGFFIILGVVCFFLAQLIKIITNNDSGKSLLLC
jgi:hypothetical protein